MEPELRTNPNIDTSSTHTLDYENDATFHTVMAGMSEPVNYSRIDPEYVWNVSLCSGFFLHHCVRPAMMLARTGGIHDLSSLC